MSEIFIPLFIVLWFGLSALIVGIVDFGLATSFVNELILWIALSVVFLVLWFVFFKNKTITKSEQSDSNLNIKGVVSEKVNFASKEKVIFDTPVLGSSEWLANADEDIKIGENVYIVEVNGQLIKVKKG